MIAATRTATKERRESVRFSETIGSVKEQLATRLSDTSLTVLDSPVGKILAVRRSSSYWEHAERLVQEYPRLELEVVPERMNTEDLVERGDLDLTIADSHILDVGRTWRNDVNAAFTVGDTAAHAWALRSEDTDLKDSSDAFFRSEYRGRWFNITYNKYFKTAHRILERVGERHFSRYAVSEAPIRLL